ncbi:Secreted effector protein PipB2 [Pandoraea horticolens]|uniref:Secreted effector protein PipB2 n=1 Tax=Pandoraea horticolens TaxID=2508298 RepID=A0A5E4YUF3_9BURK|nr:DUF2169 domain-containing protein [Pandoraea horticolens]VVE52068.1 Secreted effector protein PipB2 [Pandoraea horticolens]
MRIAKPTDSLILLNAMAANGRPHVCVTLGYLIGADGKTMNERSAWQFLRTQFGQHVFDEGLKKTRGTFAVAGNAYSPAGTRASTLSVTARLGDISKTLKVYGERRWTRTRQGWRHTEPLPFDRMPVDLQHAYGGQDWPANPTGQGHCVDSQEIEGVLLPNVEWPAAPVLTPQDAPAPATFLPIPAGTPERQRLVGTTDEHWLRTRFPGFPDDTDSAWFDALAADQCISTYWRGDETFELIGMHAEKCTVAGRLPGLRPRLLWCLKPDIGRVREALLQLDTVWLFPNDERVLVLYRAFVETGESGGADAVEMFVHTESLTGPAETTAMLMKQWRPDGTEAERAAGRAVQGPNALAQADAVWAEISATHDEIVKEIKAKGGPAIQRLVVPPLARPAPGPDDTTQLNEEAIKGAVKRTTSGVEDEIRQTLKAAGVDVDGLFTSAERHSATARLPVHAFDAAALPPNFTQKNAAELADAESLERRITAEVASAHAATSPGLNPLAAPHRVLGAETLRAAHARGETVTRVRLEDADLSNMDLSDADLSGSEFVRCKLSGAKLVGAKLDDARLVECELDGVDARHASARRLLVSRCAGDRVGLASADLSDARFVQCGFAGADLSGARLQAAAFVKSSLAGANLMDVQGRRARFTASDLAGVDATRANLEAAILEDSPISGARFVEAYLRGASLWGVQGEALDFRRASMAGVRVGRASRLERSCFDEADLVCAGIEGAVLCGSTLRGARLDAALLADCDLSGTDARHCVARGADFSGSKMVGAEWSGANLMQASLRRCVVLDANFSHANLYEVDVRTARAERIAVPGALLTRCAWQELQV